ncbi:MAG: hypothetical protein A3E78_12930 [Alphaproteobacteria bacterium RIFCSPHIGHO2_12_FULL_63_12]|nr:MAG: hypothetical protein A3E78_12930 [Alphaproteobacteria bacterium RIFCSPHIGHO2_12_FULL_63_12]
MRNFAFRMSLAVLAAASLSACGKKEAAPAAPTAAPAPEAAAPAPSFSAADWTDASGDFVSPTGDAIGKIEFKDGLGGVLMRINVSGLTPGWHGIHLHMVADCSDGAEGFKASGGHLNPDNVEHGLLNPNGAHRADIPNIFAGADGNAEAEIFRAGVNLKPSEEGAAINGPYPLMDDDGFAVIIHESPDDHLTQPIGGAGARVACAAIKG